MGLLKRLLGGLFGTSELPPEAGAAPGADSGGAHVTQSADKQFALVYSLLDAGKYDEALAAALEATATPVIADDFIPVAEGFLQGGHADHARRILQQLIRSNPRNAALHERLALVALAGGHVAEAHDAAVHAETLDGTRPWPRVVVAECKLRAGRHDDAQAAYQSLADLGAEWLMCRTVRFDRAFFDELEALDDDLAPPAVVVAPSSPDFDHVVLVSCDSAYFAQYAGSFVNAFARNGGTNGLLHLHVVDPAPDFADRIARLIAKTCIKNIAITSERMPFPELQDIKRRTYYTCARFLHFGGWLEYYKRPIACFDVDAIVERPLAKLLDTCRNADLGLVSRVPPRAIWLDTVAYTVVARPTDAAAAYFRLLRRFLLCHAAKRHLYWQIDQIALRCTLIMQQRFANAPATVDIYDSIDDVAWLLARRRSGGKTGDPVYLAYQIDI